MNVQDKQNFRSKESLQNKSHLQFPLHSIIFVYTSRFISNTGTNLSEILKITAFNLFKHDVNAFKHSARTAQ